MTTVVAQTAFERMVEGDWWVVTEPYMAFGGIAFAMVVVTIMIALYINTDSLAIPAVVAMLAGGVVAEYAPAPVARGAVGVIILGVTLFGGYLYIERRQAY